MVMTIKQQLIIEAEGQIALTAIPAGKLLLLNKPSFITSRKLFQMLSTDIMRFSKTVWSWIFIYHQ